MAKSGEKSKESLINCEIKRLNKIFGLKGEDAKGFQQELIQNAAFMAVSLRELQGIINQVGYSDEYQNGKDQSAATFRFLVMEKTGLILFAQYYIPLFQKTQIDSVPTDLARYECTDAEYKGGFEPEICLKSKIGIIGKNDQRQG